jgi:hypothetical protein
LVSLDEPEEEEEVLMDKVENSNVLVFVCGPLTRRLIKPLLQNEEPRNKRDFVRGFRQTITGTL